MSRLLYLAAVAMLCIAAFGGCASSPIRTDYSRNMPPVRDGVYLDKVWVDESALATTRYSEVRLSNVHSLGISDQTNITVSEAVSWLREAMVLPGTSSVVLRSAKPGQVATMELVITELDPGSTAARFWVGEFGAGHAWVQVEGKLTDATDHRLLAYFVERDRKSGVATFRNSRGYDSGPGLVQDILKEISEKVRQEIGEAFHLQNE